MSFPIFQSARTLRAGQTRAPWTPALPTEAPRPAVLVPHLRGPS
ncbi:hypothetical protein [Deinococcus sp. Leaf326]|nr:hypothetical protein [Deinococcus sp. Leaf326]